MKLEKTQNPNLSKMFCKMTCWTVTSTTLILLVSVAQVGYA